MGMSLNDASHEDEAISTINTTPLVDVMLVLLIIFLITIPVAIQTHGVQLPKDSNVARESKFGDVNIAVNSKGDVFWNDLYLRDKSILVEKLKQVSVLTPQPEVHIRGDRFTKYESIGKVIVACQRAGIAKISFIIEPPPKG